MKKELDNISMLGFMDLASVSGAILIDECPPARETLVWWYQMGIPLRDGTLNLINVYPMQQELHVELRSGLYDGMGGYIQ